MQKEVESLLQAGNGEKAMEILAKSRLPMIDAGEHEVVGKVLGELVAGLPGRVEPLEWLVELYGRTSDSFRSPDALAHLGDALVAQQQWERAKKTFEQLLDREPDSDSAKRKLNGVLAKMGLLAPGEVGSEELLQTGLAKAAAPRGPPGGRSAPEAAARPPCDARQRGE